MANDNASGSVAGIGFPGLLTVLFIYLKLTHQIDWSWWWVWAPLLICWGFVIGILLVIGIAIALWEYLHG